MVGRIVLGISFGISQDSKSCGSWLVLHCLSLPFSSALLSEMIIKCLKRLPPVGDSCRGYTKMHAFTESGRNPVSKH